MVKNPVGVIGPGLMGTAITERLLDEGFDVLVHNRTKAKAEPLTERGAIWSDNPLADCDRVIICLYTTEVVAEVLDSMQSALRTGLVLIDTTTGEPKQTTSLGQRLAKQSGVSYLDAPISVPVSRRAAAKPSQSSAVNGARLKRAATFSAAS
ncbi:MAG: NAD(P)-binding domain-containing protein [Pirellulales bacterium]